MKKPLLTMAMVLFVGPCAAQEWRDMSSAPRDGTTIEIKNTWGVAPWYGLFRWSVDRPMTGWVSVTKPMTGIGCSLGPDTCHWRPYDGSVEAYVDPTHGAQFTVEYWRNAPPIRRW